jgi:hypothetical protein
MLTNENGRHIPNTSDRSVLYLSQSLRDAGYKGLTDQMQVWLQGRIDSAALRRTLARLNRAHPVVTARLVWPKRGPMFWQHRTGAECVLREESLPDSSDDTALRRAAEILSAADDPKETDAVQFHLLHLPDGRDLFLVQHDHCLMDINGTKLLLQEINRLAATDVDPPAPTARVEEDGIRTYLRRFSLRQRLRAVWHLPRHLRPIKRCVPVSLSDATAPTPGGTVRIALRELDEQQTEAFTKRTKRICGFPSLSMAVLAGVVRAILRHTPHTLGDKSAVIIPVGTNLRGRAEWGPIFHNLCSLLPMFVRPEEAQDWGGLVQMLNRQMRERLSSNVDLALLQWGWWLRKVLRLQRRIGWDLMFGQGVDFGYMGVLAAKGERFCGVPIARVFPVAQIYSPPALSMAPSICGGRLLLPALYVADTVPEARIQAFLDTLVADLVGSSEKKPLAA